MMQKTRFKKEEEIETSQESSKETPKGQEEDYMFPKERITIRASSLEEAKRKLREIK